MKKLYMVHGFAGMSAAERKMGRLMRAPDGHGEGGGTPSGGDNNGGGNFGAPANGESGQNNTGNEFDPTSFWGGQASDDGNGASGDSPNGAAPKPDDQQQQNGLAQQLGQRMDSMTFGDNLFTAEIADQLNEGNFEGFQERFNQAGRQIVREALQMQMQILRPFAEQLMQQVRQDQQQTFDSRDNKATLEEMFPAAKNPVVAQTIKPIYERALKNSKGNREEAVRSTKEMLRFMAGESANDLNLEIAPRGQGDRGSKQPATNWLAELTARQ